MGGKARDEKINYLARSSAISASNLSLHAKNVSRVTGSPCGTITCEIKEAECK